MALAMAIHGQEPLPEDGTVMNSTLAAPGGVEVDVFRGHSRLLNPRGHPDHNDWYDLEEMRPALVHFLGSQVSGHPYRREEIRLERWPRRGGRAWAATAWADLTFSRPWAAKKRLKALLRPLYRRVAGVRAVQDSRSRV